MAGLGSEHLYGMDGEFYNAASRKRRKMTKDDHIYGVFNEHNSGRREKQVDLTRGMAFVSAGTVSHEELTTAPPKQKPKASNQRRPPPRRGPRQGEFERHTRGIGSKLMKAMGYVDGQGLGKHGQGITTAIESKVRPRNLGLGNMDESTHQLEDYFAEKRGDAPQGQGDMEEEQRVEAPQNWRRSKPKKKKIKYKTVSDLQSQEDAPRLVIHDMTGPSARIVTDASQLNAPASNWMAPTGTFMPELKYNIRMLVDMKENQIRNLYFKMNDNDKRQAQAKEESIELQKRIAKEEKSISSIQKIMQMIDAIKSAKGMSLSELEQAFTLLMTKYKAEYKKYKLSSLAHSFVIPVIDQFLASWDPLVVQQNDPTPRIIGKWKELLWPSLDDFSEDKDPYDTYNYIVFYVVLPRMREALMSHKWSPRDPEPCTQMLEAWGKYVGSDAIELLKAKVILPKIEREVNNWNPMVDNTSIHLWLHQYLPHFGIDPLKHLWGSIRQVLSTCLRSWHASDSSALMMIQPWKHVFSDANMESFLARAIIPKLEDALKEFQINPQNQKLDQLKWVLSWKDVLPPHHMGTLFNNEFFPKWFVVLHHWLSSGTANLKELTQWYVQWKALFPKHILEEKSMQNNFTRGLLMIHTATEKGNLKMPDIQKLPYLRLYQNRPAAKREAKPYFSTVKVSLKELLISLAQENDLFCAPTGKRYRGKQIYKFGHISLYMEDNVVFTHQNGDWEPTSTDVLLSMSKQ